MKLLPILFSLEQGFLSHMVPLSLPILLLSGIAFSSQDFILECKEGEDGIHNVILMQPSIEQAQWVSMQEPVSGNIYIEDNLYEVVFIARYDTTVFKINRYTGTFTRESGTPPFGVMKKDNRFYVGHCQSRDASPRF